ncbi:MAG TPA: hypothetical protein P5123_12805 [Spirochaetota bacterium]|nr:hypothetical protein [Spirochaetota bacterium]
MSLKFLPISIFLLLLVISCSKTKNNSEANTVNTEASLNDATKENAEDDYFEKYDVKDDSYIKNKNIICWVDNLRIRKHPDEKSETLDMIKQGEIVYSLGKSTQKQFEVELRGIKISGNWEYIMTKQKVKGWVFSGGLSLFSNFKDYNIYGLKDTIFIESKKTQKILYNEKLKAIKDQYINFTSIESDENYLIIYTYYDYGDPEYVSIIVFDMKNNQKVCLIDSVNFYIGRAPSDDYFVFDSGTAANNRIITIFSKNKDMIVFNENPFTYDYSEWKTKGVLYYYHSLGSSVEGKPELKDNYIYAQKYIWKNEEITKTNIIEELYME